MPVVNAAIIFMMHYLRALSNIHGKFEAEGMRSLVIGRRRHLSMIGGSTCVVSSDDILVDSSSLLCVHVFFCLLRAPG